MRVAFISRRYWPAISGMSVYAENLLREVAKTSHRVTMLSQFRGDDAGTKVYGGGPPPTVPHTNVIGMRAYGEEAGGDFERDIDDLVDAVVGYRDVDVVHAQYGYPCGLAALEAGRRLDKPVVVSIQGGDGHWVGDCCATHRDAMRIVCEHANAVLIGSASFRDATARRLDLDPDLFTIVPGAVDVTRFTPQAPNGGTRLLYHGRVDRRKGILDLLEALPRVPDARLTVSGIGPDYDEARRIAADQALPVAFLGRVDYARVPDVYRDADVFVSPTYAEGFSNTVLEAMAAGLPIVAGRSVGVVDALRDEDNALLVEPGDVDGLSHALARLTRDDALRMRLRERALHEVRTTYAWPQVARAIVDTYERVADEPPSTGWTMPREKLPCRYREAPHLL